MQVNMANPIVKFHCSRWGHESVPWNDFVSKVKQHGFAGVEIIALRFPEQKQEMLYALTDSGLDYSFIYTEKKVDNDFKKYLRVMEAQLLEIATTYRAGSRLPSTIIAQIGREYFTPDQVGECFAVCDKVSNETGIPVIQETHRFRWSYAAHVVKNYLEQFPNLKLALDLSHWFCVSESFLEDQQEAIDMAIDHTVHLHARVGHTQGPQVTDPRTPENATALAHHLKYWDQWINNLRGKGVAECTITPEFGPYPYMIHSPADNKPVADLWEVNGWMKEMLSARYK